jgi:hypothetical protein
MCGVLWLLTEIASHQVAAQSWKVGDPFDATVPANMGPQVKPLSYYLVLVTVS